METTDNKLNLLKKLSKLADGGIDGEKENATERLEFLMKKYGITSDMLQDEIKKEREITIQKEQSQFFYQIVCSVCGRQPMYFNKADIKKKKTRVYIEVSDIDFIEISEKFYFYWDKYQEDLNLFYSAFIQKNHLYTKTSQEDIERANQNFDKDRERIIKLSKMMEGLDSHKLQKQLSN